MTIYVKKVPALGLCCFSKDGVDCCFHDEIHGCTIAHRSDISCNGVIFVRVPEPQNSFQKRVEDIANRLSEKIREDIIKELNECNDLYEDTHSL